MNKFSLVIAMSILLNTSCVKNKFENTLKLIQKDYIILSEPSFLFSESNLVVHTIDRSTIGKLNIEHRIDCFNYRDSFKKKWTISFSEKSALNILLQKVSNDYVLYTNDKSVHILDAMNGKELMNVKGNYVELIDDCIYVFFTLNADLKCINIETNEVVWSLNGVYPLSQSLLEVNSVLAYSVDSMRIEKSVLSLNAKTGNLNWIQTIPDFEFPMWFSTSKDNILITTGDSITALNGTSGSIIWSNDNVKKLNRYVFCNNSIVFNTSMDSCNDNRLVALEKDNGEIKWVSEFFVDHYDPIYKYRDKIFVNNSKKSEVCVVNSNTGELVNTLSLPKMKIKEVAVLRNGNIVIGTDNSGVYVMKMVD